MEILPLLFFGYIAFQIFKGFTKSNASQQGDSAKVMMKRLNAQIQEASKTQQRTSHQERYKTKTPTQRGRESLQRQGQYSPWNDKGKASPGAQVAANYLKAQTKAARKAAHKSPEQHGRRGKNMDQNRHRTDGWGQRGDRDFLSGKVVVSLLVIGGVVLYVLSQLPAT